MGRRGLTAGVSLALAAAVFLLYMRVAGYEFVSMDDSMYVFNNPQVQGGLTWEGVRWSLTTFQASNWHPLTWISHMADSEFFELGATGPHIVNVGLHAANAVLLFIALRLMTGALWASALVAALFALHPIRVESVAWVSERKDVLSGLFAMLTLLAYGTYARSPGLRRYLLVCATLALGLMAKPMLVTLPLVLLLLDIWPLGRWQGSIRSRAVVEKLPLLGIALASSAITLIVQHRAGGLGSFEKIPLGLRLANSSIAYASYLRKTFWPSDLAVFYPHPALVSSDPVPAMLAPALVAVVLLLGLSVFVLVTLRTRPYLAVGWFWFLGMLFPVIGIVQVGEQSFADRYAYLPLVGIYLALVWGARELALQRPRLRLALVGASSAALVACATLTWFQVGTWRNSITLFEHAAAATRNNYVAHTSLGSVLVHQGKAEEALYHYERALASRADYPLALSGLATTYTMLGLYADAEKQSRRALARQPDSPDLLNNLGAALYQQGRADEAAQYFERAVEIQPSSMSHTNLGGIYLQRGRIDDAAHHLEEALRLDPSNIAAHLNLGGLRMQQSQLDDAAKHFESALRLQPGHAYAQQALRQIRGRATR